MSITDNCIQLENGSDLRSFINHAASMFESLKSASEPIVLLGTLSGDIPATTDTYSDVTIKPYNTLTNFSTDFAKIEDNTIELTPDFCCGVLLTSCEITLASNTTLYQRLSYQEIGSSEWKVYGASVKRQVFAYEGHQSVHEMWILSPSYPIYKYKLEITSDKAGVVRDTRQNCFALIAVTNSQKG